MPSYFVLKARKISLIIIRFGPQCDKAFIELQSVILRTCASIRITKTCLYNFDPLQPHFYMVKLGFTRIYIIFLISAQNIDCGYSLEPPRQGGSNEYQQPMF